MKHLGDITKINGAEIPIVDVITGGSPCQDLSVAGKRAGLDGERSGLFMEQIRIVKEMREHDRRANHRTGFMVRPRFMVWENVAGAFSSGKPKGADFQTVLTEIVRVVQECPAVPLPKDGKWRHAGCLYDEMGGWSVAWRVHDAQFWGVPQRRKRIALVADFGGLSAPEILFERKGLSRDIETSGEAGETVAGTVERSIDKAISFQERAGKPGGGKGILIQHERTGALSTLNNQSVIYGICSTNSNSMKSSNPKSGIYKADTARTLDLNGGNPSCNQGGVAVVYGESSFADYSDKHIATLKAQGGHNGGGSENLCVSDSYQDTVGALCSGISKGTENQIANQDQLVTKASVVRRLTPMECERLQGYPDHWTDIGEWTDSKGKKHKPADSPRYKALGNSIALPFWFYLLRRIAAQYERPATLGSLFDGIGGFPLCWERCNGKGTALWASEIEEFPIAVTKVRFPED